MNRLTGSQASRDLRATTFVAIRPITNKTKLEGSETPSDDFFRPQLLQSTLETLEPVSPLTLLSRPVCLEVFFWHLGASTGGFAGSNPVYVFFGFGLCVRRFPWHEYYASSFQERSTT